MQKKKTTKNILVLIFWILLAIPLVISCAVFVMLPDMDVAIHFDISGQPNRWGGKLNYLGETAATTAIAAFLFFATKLSSQNSKTPERHWTASLLLLIAMLIIFNAIALWGALWNIPQLHSFVAGTDLSVFAFAYLGALMIITGLLVPLLAENALSGARVPWNLPDGAWGDLQLFARRVLIFAGLIELIMCIFVLRDSVASVFTLAIMIVTCVAILIYGYRLRGQKEL